MQGSNAGVRRVPAAAKAGSGIRDDAPATRGKAGGAGRVRTPGASAPSTGLAWALVSLALDIMEVLVLVEVIFFDKARIGAVDDGLGFLEIYFIITLAAAVGQGLGVLLVARGLYRVGGMLQIVSSSTQVIKLDGIVGVVGGIKAWRYPAALQGPR